MQFGCIPIGQNSSAKFACNVISQEQTELQTKHIKLNVQRAFQKCLALLNKRLYRCCAKLCRLQG
jgi:hypothetical protein